MIDNNFCNDCSECPLSPKNQVHITSDLESLKEEMDIIDKACNEYDNYTCIEKSNNSGNSTHQNANYNSAIHDGYDGMSPIIFATKSANIYLIELLLAHGADINSMHLVTGKTPIMYTIEDNNLELLQLLILYGADINRASYDGETPLLLSIKHDNNEALDILFNYGVDTKEINATLNEIILNRLVTNSPSNTILNLRNRNLLNFSNIKSTALIVATKRGNLNLVKLLIELGLNVDYTDNNLDTALSWAAYNGFVDAMNLLIEAGADVNHQDNKGNTPLIDTIIKNQREAFDILINNPNININNQGENNQSALHYAVILSNQYMVTTLLQKGADINAITDVGNTPVDIVKSKELKQLYSLFNIKPKPKVVATNNNANQHKRLMNLLIAESKECSICIEKLTEYNSTITPCLHIYCTNCFDKLFKTSNKVPCPLCRVILTK